MALWGKTDTEANKPKYLSDTLRNSQSVSDLDSTLGIDSAEAVQTANRAKGINTPGWVMNRTYTDSAGQTRNKTETLVALRSMTGDSDVLPPLPVITIGTQPANTSVVEGTTATFTVVATATGGSVLSYQWQKSNDAGATWAPVSGATSASYTTPVTVLADDNGDQYRVIVSGTLGALSVTSSAATLTVTL